MTAPVEDRAAVLDTADMQGLVARAYGHLPVALYVPLQVADPASARAWLGTVVEDVTTAAQRRQDLTTACLNLAFTWAGLQRLGLADDALATFPLPLREGMVTEHRSRVLGDTGASAPSGWRWGGPANPEIHVLLMLFAADEDELGGEHQSRRAVFTASGALVDAGDPIQGRVLDDRGSEHFGFADGLSQPVLRGWPRTTRSLHPLAEPPPSKWAEGHPGEVVLRYHDNFDKPSEGPTVAARSDDGGLLPAAPWSGRDRHHLGHDGTFLVFRQLAQDVAGFRRFLDEEEAAAAARGTPATPGLLGAKIVGRWPDGAPVVLAPELPDEAAAGANNFGYHDLDKDGLRCPLGAHVRRANPRDSSARHPTETLKSTRNHRILRRGRSYGLPLAEPPTRAGEEASAERGLLFVCLNADVERQFEFVQHTWLNNPYFAGLYGEVDPLVGTQPAGGGSFTQPADPVRRRVDGIPDFVTVRGGGYFFLPGLRALRYLSALPG